jgi:hypothetical protein
MHRPGCDPDDMRESDFLCDFCLRDWTVAAPFVEGHHGSCICRHCLETASIAPAPASDRFRCALCLEEREDPAWSTSSARLCRRCMVQSARVLARDPNSGLTPPAGA